ncbi:MAG TPA: sulfatase-like hydrolase/transferase [Pirellulales bacterium]|nr:sulfatase-like hydrolase/transferase [Pirellulales bacterium]
MPKHFFVVALCALGLACSPLAADARKPNILLIYADDLGYGELGCYGGKHVPTPNIDALAAGGIRLTQGYVSAPLCSPSRAGLMTGRYQQRFGHENNSMTSENGLPLNQTTIAQRMKKLGYATCMVGKWHLGSSSEHLPMARGFDEYLGVLGNPGSYFEPHGYIDSRISDQPQKDFPENFYTTEVFADRASQWISEHREQPWFLYLPFNAIHGPHDVTEKYLQRFATVEDKRHRQLFALLSAMDDAVGKVMQTLRSSGQEENTLVWFISDNGAPPHPDGNVPLRGNKYQCWEGGIRVPFIVQWKGTLASGTTYTQPAINLDVLPTCIAAAGGTIEPDWQLDGVNLLPYLKGENTARPHRTLYWRIDNRWAVRHDDWKLVVGIPTVEKPELFNLAKDVSEAHDVADKHPDEVAELTSLWDAWNAELADPPTKIKSDKKKAKRNAERAKNRKE